MNMAGYLMLAVLSAGACVYSVAFCKEKENESQITDAE